MIIIKIGKKIKNGIAVFERMVICARIRQHVFGEKHNPIYSCLKIKISNIRNMPEIPP